MTIPADLKEFIGLNGKYGRPTPDVGPLMPNGYWLEVACPCGVTFERWVTPEDAALAMSSPGGELRRDADARGLTK